MAIHTLSVANAILDEADSQGIDVTPMQLQKLLYFTNGWHMEIHNGQPILSDSFEAWQFGPVMPQVYHKFKEYGSKKITGRAMNPLPTNHPWPNTLTEIQKKLVSEIVGIYGSLSGPRMSNLTHKPGTPWSQTWNGGIGNGNNIPSELIIAEFKKLRNAQSTATS